MIPKFGVYCENSGVWNNFCRRQPLSLFFYIYIYEHKLKEGIVSSQIAIMNFLQDNLVIKFNWMFSLSLTVHLNIYHTFPLCYSICINFYHCEMYTNNITIHEYSSFLYPIFIYSWKWNRYKTNYNYYGTWIGKIIEKLRW